MRVLVESKVKTLVLLKLSDQGKPSFDQDLAKELDALGVYCFGATPKLLIDIMARILRDEDIAPVLAQTRGGAT